MARPSFRCAHVVDVEVEIDHWVLQAHRVIPFQGLKVVQVQVISLKVVWKVLHSARSRRPMQVAVIDVEEVQQEEA